MEAQEHTTKLQNNIQGSVDEDWDPELATGSSLTEIRVREVLDDATRSKLFEAFERSDEFIPWEEWISGPVVTAEAATINSWQVSNIILEETVGRRRRIIRDGMVVCERENGEIKKRRYAKRGDGTRRHGRPPDLTLGRPFGHSESWNMGVYPGRGPALISRADMIILPPTTPSAIASENSSTLPAGVSVHSAAGASVTDFLLTTFTVDSAPGPVTPTAMRDDDSLKSPTLHAPKLS